MNVEDRIKDLCRKAVYNKIGIICNAKQAQEILNETHSTKNARHATTAIFFDLYSSGNLIYTRTNTKDPVSYCMGNNYPYYEFSGIMNDSLNKIEEHYNI